MNAPVVRLSAGFTRARTVVTGVFVALLVVLGLPMELFMAIGVGGMGGVAGAAGKVFWVLTPATVFVIVYALLRMGRTGADLSGTEVTVRGAFRTQRVDLATAQSLRVTNTGIGNPGKQLVTLDARGDARGRSLTVPFYGAPNGFLPLPEVEALERAIRSGHRAGVAAEQAEHAIRELRVRADNPAPHPR